MLEHRRQSSCRGDFDGFAQVGIERRLCIDDREKIAPDEKSGAKLAVMDGLDELSYLGCLRLGRSEMGSELVEEPSLSTRQGSPDPRLVLRHELGLFPLAPVVAGYMAGCRHQKSLRVRGRQL